MKEMLVKNKNYKNGISLKYFSHQEHSVDWLLVHVSGFLYTSLARFAFKCKSTIIICNQQ